MEQSQTGQLNKIIDKLTDNRVAIGFEELVVSSDAIGFQSIPYGATSARCVNEGYQIRFKEFGVPTESSGVIRNDGSAFDITTAQNLSQFLAIATGNDSKLNITYYK